MAGDRQHAALLAELSRRDFVVRAGVLGLAALVADAAPIARLISPPAAGAAPPSLPDATLQAFADTIIPGRKASETDLGGDIHPLAIPGVDDLPGAVETDALALYHHPEVGFDALEGPFLADLQGRSAQLGSDFLSLSFDRRVQVVLAGLDFGNPARQVYEAAAAVPFTAFCAAANNPHQTSASASGYRVMGLPGEARNGYQRDFSYRLRLARERTASGSLP